MDKPAGPGMKASMLILSAGGAAIILCIGGAVAISAPKFMRFENRSRSMQSECKSNLKALATAQHSYYAEYDRYSPKLAEVGFAPEKGNRYLYRAGSGAPGDEAVAVDASKFPDAVPAQLEAAIPANLRAKLGVSGTCPACELTAVCAGNLDDDNTIDLWFVTMGFEQKGDRFVPTGYQPINLVDDTKE